MAVGRFWHEQRRQVLKQRGCSPAVPAIAVPTAIATRSLEEAAELPATCVALQTSARLLQTLCLVYGSAGVDERIQKTVAYEKQTRVTPRAHANSSIALAVVMIECGRLQIRQRNQGPGVRQPACKETKTALLMRMMCKSSPTNPPPGTVDVLYFFCGNFQRIVASDRASPCLG
jgi:hypothetical protein